MWTTWPKRHFLFLNQVMAPITYSHLRAPQISHTAGILQLAFFLRLPCQHHWFFRLWRTQSIYVIYNKFHTCRASCIPKDQKKNHQKNPKPLTTSLPMLCCRFTSSQGLTDLLLSLNRGHFMSDAWQHSILTKNNEPVCLQQQKEFKVWILKQENQTYWTMPYRERCPQNLRTLCSQHQKRAKSCSIV